MAVVVDQNKFTDALQDELSHITNEKLDPNEVTKLESSIVAKLTAHMNKEKDAGAAIEAGASSTTVPNESAAPETPQSQFTVFSDKVQDALSKAVENNSQFDLRGSVLGSLWAQEKNKKIQS